MLISVIIPCYNVENYIKECIDSVINQTYKKIEIVCIDNNSTDSTWNKLLELNKQFPSIILAQELKPGSSSARNKGISLAKGNWLQFLDADDLLEPTKIENQVKIIESNQKKISFIAGACIQKKLNGEIIKSTEFETNKYIAPFINKCGNTCSNIWDKAEVIRSGLWDENIKSSQETELMLKIILNGGDFIIDSSPLTIIRERVSGQISQRNPVEKWNQYIEIRLNYLTKLKEINYAVYEKHKNLFYDFLMVSILTLLKYDKKGAIDLYNKSIKDNWITAGEYGFSKSKCYFIKLFGLNVFAKFLLKN